MNLQVPYHLHAVLVHEGQANAGHYWAFIYDQPRKSWLKYNDISVTESSWEELERDSFGGLRNASAYCLMYISDKVSHVVAGRGAKAVLTLMHDVLSNVHHHQVPQCLCGVALRPVCRCRNSETSRRRTAAWVLTGERTISGTRPAWPGHIWLQCFGQIAQCNLCICCHVFRPLVVGAGQAVSRCLEDNSPNVSVKWFVP